MNGRLMDVTAALSPGLPSMEFGGFPEGMAREARTRVRAALEQSGVDWPLRRVSVTARQVLPVVATSMDLAVALAVAVAVGEISEEKLEGYAFIGELGLSGSLRSMRGVLPMVAAAKEAKIQRVIVPNDNVQEALAVSGIEVLTAGSLAEVLGYFRRGELLSQPTQIVQKPAEEEWLLDGAAFPEVAWRAAEIAAAGQHDMMMVQLLKQRWVLWVSKNGVVEIRKKGEPAEGMIKFFSTATKQRAEALVTSFCRLARDGSGRMTLNDWSGRLSDIRWASRLFYEASRGG
jgi:magnesium chelatase family protein